MDCQTKYSKLILSPYVRITILLLGIIGTLLCTKAYLLTIFWILVLLPLSVILGIINLHRNILVMVAIPMTLLMLFLNIVILKESFLSQYHTAITILKIISYTSIFQIVFVIPNHQLLYTLHKFKIKGDALIIILGAFSVWREVVSDSAKIVTARYAKGYIKKRSMLNNIKQLPRMLIPLTISILNTSEVRSKSWDNKAIIQNISKYSPCVVPGSYIFNSACALVFIVWLLLNIRLS